MRVPADNIPASVTADMAGFDINDSLHISAIVLPEGCKPHEEGHFYTVTDVTDEVVVLDGNHPLAGIAVRFELTLVGVRDATAEELESGLPDEAHAQALRVLDKPHASDPHLH